jgi:hypothetical protein
VSIGLSKGERESEWHAISEGLKNLLVVARIHEVEHIVTHTLLSLSDSGCQEIKPSNWRKKLLINSVNLIKSSGLNYSIIWSSLLMENFLEKFRSGNTIRIQGDSAAPIHWVSAKDLGELIGKMFFQDASYKESFVYQGKEAVTLRKAANQFVQQVPQKNLSIADLDGNMLKLFSLLRSGTEEEGEWFQMVNQFKEKFESERTWELFGKPQITFTDFLNSLSESEKFSIG